MLRDNKVSKYLLYAIGEIVLVLIGILLALQINAWKQHKNNNETLGLHINAILDETQANISMLKTMIRTTENDIADSDILIKLYTAQDFSNQTFENKLYVLYNTQDFAPETASFENLKNSPLYALIKNFAVKKSLAEAYKTFERIKIAQEIDRIPKEAFYTNYILPKGFLISSMPKSESFFDNPYFGNMSKTVLETNLQLQDRVELSLKSFQELDNVLRAYYESLDIGSLKGRVNLLEFIEQGNSTEEVIEIVKTQDPNNPKVIITEEGEQILNSYGYALLSKGKNAEALKIFELNKELYPTSPNTHDSYGEGLLILGDTINAIRAYKKALELDPAFPTALAMLKKIEK